MVTRLVDGVWWFDLQGANAYLVEDDAGVTLVDSGLPWHRSRLARGITTAVERVSAVDRVLVTHFDVDHVGTLGRLSGLDAPVYVGVEDEPYLSGRASPDWRNRKGALQRVADLVRGTPDLSIATVSEGDSIDGFTTYHTPGHTPGHTCFVHEGLSAAFIGDLARETDGRFERPPWVLNHDHEGAGESVVAFADRAPAFEIACPGHGTPFVERGSERLRDCASALSASTGA